MNWLEVKKKSVGKRYEVSIILVALFLFLVPSIALTGVTEDESGFYLGLALMGTSFHSDLNSSVFNIKEDGGGAQISVGYRFNPVFMLEVAASGSNHETSNSAIDAEVTSAQIFGYYRFLPEKTFRPYIKCGLAGYSLKLHYGSASARLNGGGIAIGVGFKCFLSRRFSLGVDFTHDMIKYDKAELSLGDFSYELSTDEHGRLTTLGITAGYSF